MTLTAVLSGPKAQQSQALAALTTRHPSAEATHSHGMTDTVSGKKIRQAVAFIRVDGVEDVDAVAAAAAPVGYVLRQHFVPAPPTEPTALDLLAAEVTELRATVDRLTGGHDGS